MNYNLQVQNGLLLRVAGQAQTPNFEPIELLVPPLAPPDTAAVACFLLKKHTCKVWAGAKGGPVSGRSPRHGEERRRAEARTGQRGGPQQNRRALPGAARVLPLERGRDTAPHSHSSGREPGGRHTKQPTQKRSDQHRI